MPKLTACSDLLQEVEGLLRCSDDNDPIVVSRDSLRTALMRTLSGEIGVAELVLWANHVELLDQVQYEYGFETCIADILFRIASPEINGPISPDLFHQLLSQLANPPA